MATALAGGLGCSYEEMCGALSGGAMVIGAVYGRVDAEQDDELAQTLATRYRKRFHDEFGATCCGPIRDWAKGPEGPGRCGAVVERAARILLALLDEAGE
jgi:C_GCAxxG_C_C family probable redox protein